MPIEACAVCGDVQSRRFTAREMMFGLRERYDYAECARCGCLQQLAVPEDLSSLYRESYYSFRNTLPPRDGRTVAAIKRVRAPLLLRAPAPLVDELVYRRLIPSPFMWLAGLGLRMSSSVCDVGSGNGVHLVWMRRQGFSRLEGFDPFIAGDVQVDGAIPIRQLGVDQIPGGWDLIMLNHSFEHMPRPGETLERLRELLNVGGSIVIRVPVADSWAWRAFGTDWVQLDAPRHLFLHTRRSIEILGERAGLQVSRVFFDSYAFQFWGSEQYRRGIPLRDPRSYGEDPATDLFTPAEIADFERRSVELNRQAAGDSAGFVLRAI